MKLFTLFALLLVASGVYAGNPVIRESATKAYTGQGYQMLYMEVRGQSMVTSSALTWYADNIGGYGSVDVSGISVSACGATPTTLSAQPIFQDGTAIGSSQTLTFGTPLTTLKSNFYKFTLAAPTCNRTVTFNFFIKD